MARIVYGVCGEGQGHASRARVLLPHLLQHHEVRLVSFGQGAANLSSFHSVHTIHGLSLAEKEGRFDPIKTVVMNTIESPRFITDSRRISRQLFEAFRPDAVISDFEPMTAWLAKLHNIPLISLDHTRHISDIVLPDIEKLKRRARLFKILVSLLIPNPAASLVISFCDVKPAHERVFIFPPILRRDILEGTPSVQDYTLVYITAYAVNTFLPLLDSLAEFPERQFIVYGFPNPGQWYSNVLIKGSDVSEFTHDLLGASAVITTSGFTTLSECLYLRKPALTLPVPGQFEQELSAYLFEHTGCGMAESTFTYETLVNFFSWVETYRERLQSYSHQGNDAIFALFDQLLADDCTYLKILHVRS
jgi:uncharacterized protein (TIGR00661 family)